MIREKWSELRSVRVRPSKEVLPVPHATRDALVEACLTTDSECVLGRVSQCNQVYRGENQVAKKVKRDAEPSDVPHSRLDLRNVSRLPLTHDETFQTIRKK